MADATDTKATGGSSKRTAAIATIITLVVLALVGGGLAYGLHARQEQEAQQAFRVVPTAAAWRMEDVRKHFRDKHNITFWVGAETRRVNGHEEFRYTDVSITHRPDYMRMEEFIANGWITVDLAMYLKPSKNDPQRLVSRDHGFLWKANGKGMQGLFSKGIRYDLKS